MKALMYQGARDMPLVDIPEPEPGENEVKISVSYCGICGSDIHGYTGESGRKIPPMIMGHEFSGRVTALGEKVTKFRVGDRVTVQPVMFCGTCEFCRAGNMNICKNRRGLGVLDVNGAFTEYICVEEQYVYLLPDHVDDYAGAMLEPLSVAYHAVKHIQPVGDKNIFIAGTGTIGLLILKLVRAFGAGRIVVTDLSDDRLSLAEKLGADITINPSKEDVALRLRQEGLTEQIDLAIECVGASSTAQQTVECVKIKGMVLWVGNAAKMIQVNMQQIVTRELTVKGTYAFTETDFKNALGLLAEEKIKVSDLITRIVPLEQTEEAMQSLLDHSADDIKILVKVR